jgi:hypothetical protein
MPAWTGLFPPKVIRTSFTKCSVTEEMNKDVGNEVGTQLDFIALIDLPSDKPITPAINTG